MMPIVTPALALVIFVAGAAAGGLGALLGIGGGVFLVPLLNIGLGFPISVAAVSRPDWLVAVLDTPGVQVASLEDAMQLYGATIE